MALDALLNDLLGGDEARAEAAARGLQAYGETALHALDALRASSDVEARWWAVRALAEFSAGQAAPRLAAALDDSDLAVRQCAALGLSQRPGVEAIPALAQALASPDSLLARLAANALAAAGPHGTPALTAILEDQNHPGRMEAARALALAADPQAIPILYKVCDEGSAWMEYWAGVGLDRMGVGMMYFKP
jgi:HEAT repeat protein